MTREEAIDVLKHNYPSSCYEDLCKAVEIAIQALSVQPEIIRCKDCKWKYRAECVRFADVRPFPDDFCSRGERKTNG